MKLGSLFDGSGGFPLAGVINGMDPVWASEIEPYPLKVTAARFPNMVQLGDVTKIDGAAIEPVDVITFGSPCQDLSVAGKQAGIHDGERSNLFFEAIRIIKEMRERDRAAGGSDWICRPRFAVWENVPGAFSSHQGEDFRAYMFLCLKKESGRKPDASWGMAGALHGEPTTLNTGEYPSGERGSTLSQILQANAPEKYYLSAKACAGILRRAMKRGKSLPPMLQEALMEVVLMDNQ